MISKPLDIGEGTLIEAGASIGENVSLGRYVRIFSGAIIESNCIIEDFASIGYHRTTRIYDDSVDLKKTVIGAGTLVRSHSVIYAGCKIGDKCSISHHVVLREGTTIGNETSVGCLVKSEGYLTIGNRCSIHSLCSLTPFLSMEDEVFMGPGTITMNDAVIDFRSKEESEKKGPLIRYRSRIAGQVTLSPGVTIGKYAFVVAGSLVVKDVPDFGKVGGVPARLMGMDERYIKKEV